MDEELLDDRCEHGILWKYECAMCEKENREFYLDLFTHLGGGDPEKGKRWMIWALKETSKKHGN